MRLLSILLPMVFFVGCQEIQKTPKPEDLIPQEKMVDVLTDISLLYGARNYNKNLLEEKGIDPGNYIYEKYDIDSLQLVKSNDYYSENYQIYQGIYSDVKARLESLKVEYDTLREIAERRKDSLRELEIDTLNLDSLRVFERDSLLPRNDGNRQLPQPMSRRDTIR